MKPLKALLMIVTSALLAGCFGSAQVQRLSDAERAKYEQTDAGELIPRVWGRLIKADADELPLYAPSNYAQAKALVVKAREMRRENKPVETVIGLVAAADKRLDAAYENKNRSRTLLAGNYALNKRLEELGAPVVAASTYQSFMVAFAAIYDEVDKGHWVEAEEGRAALTIAQEDLKVRLTKERALADLNAIHKKLDDEHAREVVPLAVRTAHIALKNAEEVISAHVDDEAAIAAAVHDATLLALRAQWMASRAHQLSRINTRSKRVETIVSQELKWLDRIGDGIGGEPVHHLSADQQANTLATRARELNGLLHTTRSELNAAKDALTSVHAELTRVQTELADARARLAANADTAKQASASATHARTEIAATAPGKGD